MKNLRHLIILGLLSLGIGSIAFAYSVPPKVSDVLPSHSKVISHGFTLYNDSVHNWLQNQFIEAGGSWGRTHGTIWGIANSNQTKNPDGTYSYNWNSAPSENTDALVDNGQINIEMGLSTGGPSSISNGENLPYTDIPAYLDWVKALVTHFKGRVHYIAIENEPAYYFYETGPSYTFRNRNPYQVWNQTARNYVALYIMTAKVIKSIDPTIKMVFSDTHANGQTTDYNSYKGLDAMLDLGAGPWFDVYDLHFYGGQVKDGDTYKFQVLTYPTHNWTDYAYTVKKTLSDDGYPDKELWIGESGMGTGNVTSSFYAVNLENQELELVKQTFEFASQGFTRIFNVLLYDLGDGTMCQEPDGIDRESDRYNFLCMGIMFGEFSNPSYYLKKKPSYDVYEKMTSLTNGTVFVSTSTSDGVEAYRMSSSTYDVYAGWGVKDGSYIWSTTLDQNYSSGKIIDALTLSETDLTALSSGNTIDITVTTSTPKYLYLKK